MNTHKITQVDTAPFGKWAMVMVVLHPNGDPMDMQNMVGALKAPLSYKNRLPSDPGGQTRQSMSDPQAKRPGIKIVP